MRNSAQQKQLFIAACYEAMYNAFYESFSLSMSEDESFESRRQRISTAAAKKFREKMTAAFDIIDAHIISCEVLPDKMMVGNQKVTGTGKIA